MRTYFFTALGFAPPILLALFCFGVIGLAIGAWSKWASQSIPTPEQRTRDRENRESQARAMAREDAQTALAGPDRRESRAWVGQEVPMPNGASSKWVGPVCHPSSRGKLFIFPETLDYHRMMALETWCLGGCVEMGVEIDGGVYLSVTMLGGPEIELREQNSIRDSIDKALKEIGT